MDGVVGEGDTVRVSCSMPPPPPSHVFLYKVQGTILQRWDQVTDQRVTLTIHNVTTENAGGYECVYAVRGEKQLVYSPYSQVVQLTVRGRASQPDISLEPLWGEVMEGLTVLVTCWGPAEPGPRGTFYLFRSGQEVSTHRAETVRPNCQQARFTITNVSQADDGEYSLCFQTRKTAISPHSRSIRLSVFVAGTKAPVMEENRRTLDSLSSHTQTPHQPNTPHSSLKPASYQTEVIVRLTLSGLVLVMLGGLVYEHCKPPCRGKRGTCHLPVGGMIPEEINSEELSTF
eukprot:gi/632975436/ref/XP_007904228.1/ PREDICTED: uncharacterized protein LOC103186801 [Callorhinchus milii]